jgi:hypothetical protein
MKLQNWMITYTSWVILLSTVLIFTCHLGFTTSVALNSWTDSDVSDWDTRCEQWGQGSKIVPWSAFTWHEHHCSCTHHRLLDLCIGCEWLQSHNLYTVEILDAYNLKSGRIVQESLWKKCFSLSGNEHCVATEIKVSVHLNEAMLLCLCRQHLCESLLICYVVTNFGIFTPCWRIFRFCNMISLWIRMFGCFSSINLSHSENNAWREVLFCHNSSDSCVIGISQWKPGFSSVTVHVGFVVF